MGDSGIRRYARRLRIAAVATFGIVVALVLAGRFGVRIAGASVFLQSRSAPVIGSFAIADGALLLTGVAVYWLSEALRAVSNGNLFSRSVVRRFRLFAVWILVAALFNTLAPMALALLGSAQAGRHRILVLIDVRDLLLIALTLLILLIARMFERARAFEDEMSEIV